MLQELLDQQRRYLDYFFDNLQVEQVEQLQEAIANCEGIVFFTGVGKSGIIAKKIAATMMSTGTRALYISPINALHGDLGIVSEKDIFVFLSKSGETDELLALIPALRNKGTLLAGMISHTRSHLGDQCHIVVNLPLEKELCPFGLAPTTSTLTQLILGDLLAMALMRGKEFSIDQYAQNHPAGNLGRRMTLHVRDLMVHGENLPKGRATDKLVESLVELSQKRCGCLLVTDEEEALLGIFTDGDLRRALEKHGADALQMPLSQLMTPAPKSISADALATEAMREMEAQPERPVMVLPVMQDKSKVVGLVKMHDIVQTGL